MDELLKRKLLILIKNNGNMDMLIREGYSFKQIARWYEQLLAEGYLKYEKFKLVLDSKGIAFVDRTNNGRKLSGCERWIVSQEQYWHEPIDKFEIFLPKMRKSKSGSNSLV